MMVKVEETFEKTKRTIQTKKKKKKKKKEKEEEDELEAALRDIGIEAPNARGPVPGRRRGGEGRGGEKEEIEKTMGRVIRVRRSEIKSGRRTETDVYESVVECGRRRV